MIFDVDPGKDEANRIKHGVPLISGAGVFEDPQHLIVATIRVGDEEERFKAIGMIGDRLWTAIHLWRGDEVVRLISVRRSNADEQRAYHRDPG